MSGVCGVGVEHRSDLSFFFFFLVVPASVWLVAIGCSRYVCIVDVSMIGLAMQKRNTALSRGGGDIHSLYFRDYLVGYRACRVLLNR